jgi:hypothetical protein
MWRCLAILLLLMAIGAEVPRQALLPVWAWAEFSGRAGVAATELTCPESSGSSNCLADALAEHKEPAIARRDRYTVTRIDGFRIERDVAIRTTVVVPNAAFDAVSEVLATGSASTLMGRLIPLRI